MADDDLEEQVTCWICFEVMEEPTTLVCSHSFCKDCLVKVYKKDPNCPFCRRPFGLPLPEPNPDLLALVERLKGPKAGSSKPEERVEIEQDSPLLNLPVEVTSHILDFLEPTMLAGTGLVCRTLQGLSEDPWVWRSLCMEKFPFVGGGNENNDWKRIYLRRSKLQKGWEGGKSGDFTVTSMRGHDGYITSIDILKNQAITGGSTGQIKVWRTNTSKLSYECVGHTGLISSVKFNDIYIVSGSLDHTVKLWDTQTGTLLRSADCTSGVTQSNFNADSIVSCAGPSVVVHQIGSLQQVCLQSRPGTSALKAMMLDNGNFAVARSDAVYVHDPRNVANPVHTLNRVCGGLMEFAGNDMLAFAAGSDIVLWNYKTGAQVWSCRTDMTDFSVLHADSERIIAGTRTGQLSIMRHRNPAIKKIAAHEGAINDLQFDAHRVVTAGADNSVKVWDIKEGRILYTLLGGSLQIRGAAKPHPTRPGCSALVYDENRIVGSFANILKSFNFGSD